MSELFEKGRRYTFYFGGDQSHRQFVGEVISCEFPLVKVQTEALVRVVNCTSAHFLEAVSKLSEDNAAEPVITA